MKKVFGTFLLVFTFSLNLAAQTADDVIARYYDAIGGLDKHKAVKSILHEGIFSMPANNVELQVTIKKQRPNFFISIIEFGGQKMISAYDGKQAWMLNPMMGAMEPTVLSGTAADQIIRQADFDGDLIDYRQKGSTINLVGQNDFDGVDALQLELTRASGEKLGFYFDPDTYFLLGTTTTIEQDGQIMDVLVKFGDYQEIDGLFYPFELEIGGMQDTKFVFTNIEFNVDFPVSDFQIPSK